MHRIFSYLGRIFGLFWLVFGANGLFHFFPIPLPPAESVYFMEALEKAGYVMPFVYGTQIFAGILLLAGHLVPLALLALAPVVANILLYDLALNSDGLAVGLVIGVIHAVLLWRHRAAYIPLFAN